jgi:hypothetical protein
MSGNKVLMKIQQICEGRMSSNLGNYITCEFVILIRHLLRVFIHSFINGSTDLSWTVASSSVS